MIQQSVEIGPIHPHLPGAMKLGLGLFGDEIEAVDVEVGYLSKDLLQKIKKKTIFDAQKYISRIDPENALVVDTLVSEIIEELTGTKISQRADWIREVTLLVVDLSSALRYLALMSKQMKLDALTQVILRHREDLMDLIELLTGSRFGYDYIVPGGVRFDLSHGFSERLEKWSKSFLGDHLRIESMFYWVNYHKAYLQKIGSVVDVGGLGFISRASKENTRLGPVSTVKTRLDFILIATKEISERLPLVLSENFEGEPKITLGSKNERKNLKNEKQTLRGDWQVEFVLDEQQLVKSATIITPSDHTLLALTEALLNESFDDLPLILQSLNLSIAEIDK